MLITERRRPGEEQVMLPAFQCLLDTNRKEVDVCIRIIWGGLFIGRTTYQAVGGGPGEP